RVTEDAVYVGHESVKQFGSRQPAGGDAQRVIGLLVLAPADIADKSMIVDKNSLPAQAPSPARQAGIVGIKLVEICTLRIRHYRVLNAPRTGARSAVEVIRQHLADVVELRQHAQFPPRACRVIEAQS